MGEGRLTPREGLKSPEQKVPGRLVESPLGRSINPSLVLRTQVCLTTAAILKSQDRRSVFYRTLIDRTLCNC